MTTQIEQTRWTPPAKPPVVERGVIGWLHHNLFSSIGNSVLTIITLIVLYFGLTALLRWILNAYWLPIWENRKLFAVGPYPTLELQQPLIVLLGLCLLFGLSAGRWGSMLRDIAIGLAALLGLLALIPIGMNTQLMLAGGLGLLILGYVLGLQGVISNRLLIILWFLSLPVTFIILAGGISLPLIGAWNFATPVPTNLWGGLMLTLLLAVVGIAVSFPLGVLLALGRRSTLPVVRGFCVGYIELIRGSPLIALLFMGIVLLPLFLPPTWATPPPLIRVMVAITLFSAAYMAETVRGGLQSIASGQYEAADALGFSLVDKLRLIILPQALTKVIPALVGQFISLFKDTALVALVGLLDILGVARSVVQQPAWLGVPGGITKEVYLFTALLYFLFAYGMSFASRRLEAHLSTGQR
ncbi:MAG: amino acid ABC transporter permease [Caldilineaceae bacterium]|nr:amino acid ABC transporter permease [Caldilineaceae bacterium]